MLSGLMDVRAYVKKREDSDRSINKSNYAVKRPVSTLVDQERNDCCISNNRYRAPAWLDRHLRLIFLWLNVELLRD
jgi:hypothetical protein